MSSRSHRFLCPSSRLISHATLYLDVRRNPLKQNQNLRYVASVVCCCTIATNSTTVVSDFIALLSYLEFAYVATCATLAFVRIINCHPHFCMVSQLTDEFGKKKHNSILNLRVLYSPTHDNNIRFLLS